MSSQQPIGFENYPSQGERDGISDSVVPPPPVVTPYPLPVQSPQPQPTGGFGRRRLIGWVIGVPAAGLLGAVVLGRSDQGGETYATASEEAADPDDDSGAYVDVGDQYTLHAPDGWESIDSGGDAAVVTNGDNRLLALALTDPVGPSVTDQLLDLVEEHRGSFKGTLGEAVDTSWSSARRATLTATGSFSGEAARFRADLWIDDEDQGLLVIQTLTARKGSRIAAEAQSMADELSSGF